jgi:hypothetical protein
LDWGAIDFSWEVIKQQKSRHSLKLPGFLFFWWRGMDLNHGPSGYEPDELPDCSTPRRRLRFQRLINIAGLPRMRNPYLKIPGGPIARPEG